MAELIDPLPEHDTVAVMGLGASGRAACNLLSALGKRIIATDQRDDLDKSMLPDGIDLRLGSNDPGSASAVVLSPGLNPDWVENREKAELLPLWERAERGDVRLVSEVELGINAFPGEVIAVGGTDGKSTTASFLHHLLRTVGVDAVLGGNSWSAISQVALDSADARCAVVEVSAFQLWDGHRVRPDVAVMTNIARDHLDHFASYEDYVAAKRQLVANLKDGDTVALYAEDATLMGWSQGLRDDGVDVRTFGERGDVLVSGDSLTWSDGAVTIPLERFNLPGLHNARNVAAGLIALESMYGTRDCGDAIDQAIATFRGLPHRIELVGTLGGTRFFNDSKATNVHAACVAYRSMPRGYVAIVGGVDKRLDLKPLIDVLIQDGAHVLVIGELSTRFTSEAREAGLDVEAVDGLGAAVRRSSALAREHDKDVLFSPACSSFDMFRSFEHRGDVFRELVQKLIAER